MATKIKKFTALASSIRIVCGLDVHKHQLTVVVFGKDKSGTEFKKIAVFNTNPQGLKELWNFTQKYSPSAYVMEATGVYHQAVSLFLQKKKKSTQKDFKIAVINPADASGPSQRQKHDKVDAYNLAKLYYHDLLKPIG